MKSLYMGITALLIHSSIAVAAVPPDVARVQADWARIKYQMPSEQRVAALETLAQEAHSISEANKETAEPLIWEAIVLASLAGEDGGLSALSRVKQAKKLLEQAEKIDPDSLDGSIYTSLGSLYYQVPGWPIGFGDDDKAEQYLKQALAINPDGIDANYFYGDYLLSQRRYEEALTAFEKALQAPPRPERPIADQGRRQEILAAMDKARSKL